MQPFSIYTQIKYVTVHNHKIIETHCITIQLQVMVTVRQLKLLGHGHEEIVIIVMKTQR